MGTSENKLPQNSDTMPLARMRALKHQTFLRISTTTAAPGRKAPPRSRASPKALGGVSGPSYSLAGLGTCSSALPCGEIGSGLRIYLLKLIPCRCWCVYPLLKDTLLQCSVSPSLRSTSQPECAGVAAAVSASRPRRSRFEHYCGAAAPVSGNAKRPSRCTCCRRQCCALR